MSTLLSWKDGVRARKKHRCVLCVEPINAGELYDIRTGVDQGDCWTMKMHPECQAYERIPGAVCEDWYDDICEAAFTREQALAATKNP